MKVLLDFPDIVKKYAPYFESCFSEAGYKHFQKAISGFIVGENKTLEEINRLFIKDSRNQSSFNKFFHRQNFDLEQINDERLAMLQQNEKTRFKFNEKTKGVLSIDSTLLKHYGKHIANIYYLYDYVNKCYRWSHDLVTLYYSDDQTDYPVYHRLWDPPNWEQVADFLRNKGVTISKEKWENRFTEAQKWRNYIRSRYRVGRKKHPDVKQVYKTKLHIAEDLLAQFIERYPDNHFAVALDSGFTSAELCSIIAEEHKKDYVGSLTEKQIIIINGEEVMLEDFVAQLRAQSTKTGKDVTYKVQKTAYTYRAEKQIAYAYFANHKIKGYKKKQRLVISFLREDLIDRPSFTITNQLSWHPSGILRIRRHRWPIETYHQGGKTEGLDKYQLRKAEGIQTYLAFIVVAHSMLKYAVHDDELLSSLQQHLQVEMGSTLPFLRRLMEANGLYLLIEYVFTSIQQGNSLEQVFQTFAGKIAYI